MNQPIEEIRSLNQQAWELCKKDSPRALKLARQSQELLTGCTEATERDEYDCLRAQTYCLDMLSKPEEALPVGLKANQIALQIGDKYLIGSIQSILGRVYWHIDDYPTAMDFYLNALKIIQNEHHPDLEISLTNGLGMVQYGLENYSESLRYFKLCLEKANPDDLTGRGDASNNIGYVLHMLGRDQEALEYCMSGLALFNQLGTTVGKMETLHSLGAIHLSMGQSEQAMAFLQQGLELSRQNQSQVLELAYIVAISQVYQALAQLDTAESELIQALKIAEKINSLTNISLVHEQLVKIYKEKGDFRSALSHFEAFHEAYKKMFNEKSDRRIKNLEILHQVELTRKQADLYRELAGTDFLTKLLNRRRFLEIGEEVLQEALKEKNNLAILMADIDHFKAVNDRYGHKAGDDVLSSVASLIKKSLRQGDTAARYGGEEFIVLVSGAQPDICLKIGERIRLAVARQPVQTGAETIQVTISLGLACLCPDQNTKLETLIGYADLAMYQAKQQGRNRVVPWSAPA